jgi:Ca2+-binding RTX toxin-like protein
MTTKNIVFIDSRVAGYETLIAGLSADSEWYLLDAKQDGVDQMHRILAGYSELDSVHVISHGSSGTLYLGSTVLNGDNLTSYQTQLQAIGSSLTETGDILIYGCNVAQGDVGVSFINSLSQITGADVAASDDVTGATSLNGDWELELTSGPIESTSLTNDLFTSVLSDDYAATIGTTGHLLIGGTKSGSIESPGDIDWFKVQLNTDTTYRFETRGDSVNGALSDLYLELIDSTGASLGYAYSTNYLASLTYTVHGSGTYYVAASGFSSATGSYTVSATGVFDDYSNSTLTTGSLLVGNDAAGSIDFSGDHDWFKISLTGGVSYQFEILGSQTSENPLSYPSLRIYGETGQLLSGIYDLDSQKLFTALSNGTYYLDVSGAGTGTYIARAAIISLFGTNGNDSITGDHGNNAIFGDGGNDTIYGAAGDDTLGGGGGSDRINGGAGIDSVLGGDGNDIISTSGIDYGERSASPGLVEIEYGLWEEYPRTYFFGEFIDGGSGVDTIDYSSAASSVVVDLSLGYGYTDDPNFVSYVETAESWGYSVSGYGLECFALAVDTITSPTSVVQLQVDASNKLINFENISGSAFSDFLTGNNAVNVINGGTGADTMSGGLGNDTYYVDNAGDVVTESSDTVNGGIDTIISSVTRTLGNYQENLTLSGTGAINGTGNSLANTIIGNSVANVINGGTGADTMSGGLGNDTYYVDNAGDVVTESSDTVNGGIDTIISSVTRTLGNYQENLTLSGTGAINGTGNSLANTIIGNSVANVINGGTGADTMSGGLGNDTYYVDNAGDVVTESSDTVNGGIDTIISSVTRTLGNYQENLTLSGTGAINGTGNSLANTIIGNSVANVINGGTGADTMSGGLGNDTYYVDNAGDVVTESSDTVNGGIDTIISSVTRTLGNYQENLTLSGTGAINGTGNSLANTIIGNSVANVINGGTGADTMSGGLGNDTYYVDNAGDVVTESSDTVNGGIDTIISSVTRTLGNYQENLTLSGTGAINGTGNSLANTIIGNSVANVINGGTGADTMSGGLGNDTYYVDNAGDVVTESSDTVNGGIDTIISSVTRTLGNYQENLTLSGTGAINGTGNSLANTIIGNSVANVINGGTGADTMSGGLGNDTYYVDNAGDVVTESSTGGTDLILSSFLGTYIMGSYVENGRIMLTGSANLTGNSLNNLIYAGAGNNLLNGSTGTDTVSYQYGLVSGATQGVNVSLLLTTAQNTGRSGSDTLTSIENLTGSGLNDTLIGSAGSNILDGGLGNDSLVGGLGNDTYVINTSADIIVENASEGTDTVNVLFSGYTLGNNIEYGRISATGTASITGNALSNTLFAGAGNNAISGGTGTEIDTVSYQYGLVSGATTGVVANLATGLVTGSSGSDTLVNIENLTGSSLNDTLTGNTGNNVLNGGLGADNLVGGTGNDTYVIDNIGDRVTELAGAGTDTIQSSLSYSLVDTDGAGTNGGNVENLTLTGTAAISATGNGLANTITGNSASNSLSGGAGDDRFVFSTALTTSNFDTLTDFKVSGADKIVLDDDIFTALGIIGTTAGVALTASKFQLGTAANDTGDRIIYDQTSGKLYYDADGAGAGGQIQIALIGTTTHAALAATDFLVVA